MGFTQVIKLYFLFLHEKILQPETNCNKMTKEL